MLTFQPAPALKPVLTTEASRPVHAFPRAGAGWTAATHKRAVPKAWPHPRSYGSAWRFHKLGGNVDPEDVVDGGAQYVHGVWDGVSALTEQGAFRLETLDAATVSPLIQEGDEASLPQGPLPAGRRGAQRLSPGSVVGIAVNLHNNLWSTNYPPYQPFFDARHCRSPLDCDDRNLRFRFRLQLGGSDGSLEPKEPSTAHLEPTFDLAMISVVVVLAGLFLFLAIRALQSTDDIWIGDDLSWRDEGLELRRRERHAEPLWSVDRYASMS